MRILITILIFSLATGFQVFGQVKSDISADVDDSGLKDSSQLYQDYQKAIGKSKQVEKVIDSLNSQNFSKEELRRSGELLLEKNDTLFFNRKSKMESKGSKILDDSVSAFTNRADKKLEDLANSEQAQRINQKSDSLRGKFENNMEVIENRNPIDSLTGLYQSPAQIGSENQTVDEVKDLKRKADKVKKVRYMKSDELLSSSNVKEWPLDKEYDVSYLNEYYQQYSDSVDQKGNEVKRQLQPPIVSTEVLEDLAAEELDSIREASIEEAKIKIRKTQVGQKVDRLNLKEKQSLFVKPDYSELIVGLDQANTDRLTLTPSIAYELSKYLFIGLGLEIAMDFKEFQNTRLGYKGLARYNPEESIFYFQLESISYFSNISYFSSENNSAISSYEHALNIGGGMEYALGRHTHLNGAILYRLIQSESAGDVSPIIIRLGFTFK